MKLARLLILKAVCCLSACASSSIGSEQLMMAEKRVASSEKPLNPIAAHEQGLYRLGPKALAHFYEFNVVMDEFDHRWTIRFADVLRQEIYGNDFLQRFWGMDSDGAVGDNEVRQDASIDFELEHIEFNDYRAYARVNIKLTVAGQALFDKSYSALGMESRLSDSKHLDLMGNLASRREASQRSTQTAINKILNHFLLDIGQQLSARP